MKAYNLKKSLILGSFVLISLLLGFWIFWKIYDKQELVKEKQSSYILPDKEKNLIHDGDIILRRGFGFVSDYIVKTFDEDYKISHCGIICKSEDRFQVIHSESSSYFSLEGIVAQDFDDYTEASHQNTIIIVRFNRCEPTEYSKISKAAKYYLSKKLKFDYSFDMADSTEMYCAEIIWHVFMREFNTDIYHFPNSEVNYSQFANFWDTTYFDVILNHQEIQH